jgi:hypothetical protein
MDQNQSRTLEINQMMQAKRNDSLKIAQGKNLHNNTLEKPYRNCVNKGIL